MLLVGYLYGIRVETRLCQAFHLNLAYRWFCRPALESGVADRSSFSKNRHGRLNAGEVLRHLFETVVERCATWGLVGGTAAEVDGSTAAADANRDRRGSSEDVRKVWSTQETASR